MHRPVTRGVHIDILIDIYRSLSSVTFFIDNFKKISLYIFIFDYSELLATTVMAAAAESDLSVKSDVWSFSFFFSFFSFFFFFLYLLQAQK